MRAKFPGRCPVTGLQIRVGDDIVSDGRGGWRIPDTDPRLQPSLADIHARRVRLALRRRPDLTNGVPK